MWMDEMGGGGGLEKDVVGTKRRADTQDVFTLHLTGKLSPPYKKV